LLLTFVKPPTKEDLAIAGLVLGYALVFIMLTTLVLGGHLSFPNGFETPESGDSTRIPFLTDILGIDGRWGGPFGSVNISSAAGSLLVMLGLIYRSWNRGIFVATGLLTLFLGQARTSTFALIFGMLVLFLWSSPYVRLKYHNLVRWIVLLSSATLTFAYVAVVDPTFNYRTPTWSFFWDLTQSSPITGVGTREVTSAVVKVNEMDLPGPIFDHGHSIYMDGFARYGIIWLALTLAIFGVAFFLTWAARRGEYTSKGLAMVTFIFLAGTTETVYSWAYTTIYLLALILVVGLVSDLKRQSEPETKSRTAEGKVERDTGDASNTVQVFNDREEFGPA